MMYMWKGCRTCLVLELTFRKMIYAIRAMLSEFSRSMTRMDLNLSSYVGLVEILDLFPLTPKSACSVNENLPIFSPLLRQTRPIH